MLGVVPVAVAGDDGDHPVVVGVELSGRELLDLGHEGTVCLVELAQDVAAIAAPRSLDDRRIEGVGVVDARHPFAAFAEDREPRCGALLPRGRVRREILVRPPCRRRLLERREAERKQTETERQPARLHETDEIRGVANGRTYVGEVIGIVVRRVPLDDVERERWRVIR